MAVLHLGYFYEVKERFTLKQDSHADMYVVIVNWWLKKKKKKKR